MNRLLLPAALALCAAAAGCSPPVEKSEYINSGYSVALTQDPSAVHAQPANPPPNIQVPSDAVAAAQPGGGANAQPPAGASAAG